MIIKEKAVIQKSIGKILKENGDMMQYFQDKYQPWMKNISKKFSDGEMDSQTLGAQVQRKVVEANKKDGSNNGETDYRHIMGAILKMKPDEVVMKDVIFTESFQVEEILTISFKQITEYNDGDNAKTLQDLNEIMSRLQGTDDDNERKAYFKAKKFYERLVEYSNKKGI